MALDLDTLMMSDDDTSNNMLDTLISLESILDDTDCYVYKNVFNGEVVEGPIIRRHWVSMSLLYPHNKMPDPRFALRLMKLGITVEFSKVHQNGKDFSPLADNKENQDSQSAKNAESIQKKPDHWFWMIKLTYPRRLLDDMEGLDDYKEDGVDVDDVQDAVDSGIDAESAYKSDEQAPMGGGDEAGMPDGGDDPFAQPPGGQ
jgi:hypothetical protein